MSGLEAEVVRKLKEIMEILFEMLDTLGLEAVYVKDEYGHRYFRVRKVAP